MSDKKMMALSTLKDIRFSLKLILKRFEKVESPDDFMESDEMLEKLDSISMRLVAIGEGFKNIDKLTEKTLLKDYPSIDWRGVKGVRDILSHHYFDINAETIFDICDTKVEELLEVTEKIISDLE
jgi:uncharacterized protein with HEPN domain